MSEFAWLGVFASSAISTLAVGAYLAMAVPYFDNAPYWEELKKNSRIASAIGGMLFGVFFVIFYLSALHLDQATSGPLLLFGGFVISLPISLLLGSETWDRHNGHGMNNVPGPRAVVVATSIGLAELIGFSLAFIMAFQLT